MLLKYLLVIGILSSCSRLHHPGEKKQLEAKVRTSVDSANKNNNNIYFKDDQ